MSESITIARPYAKAIFEQALAEKQFALWSNVLTILAEAVLMPEAGQFINNSTSTTEQHRELFQSVLPVDNEQVNNLIALLAANKRLLLLPEIRALYEAQRALQEKTLEVDVISYSELSDAQQQQLADALGQRLERQVTLNIKIDPSLLGGAIIQAGDFVIDGSVRGKLQKLSASLAA